jgi:hypothetical protein
MPTVIENGALQRVAGGKEQGGNEDIWQVLGVGESLRTMSHTGCVMHPMIMFTLSYAV